MYRKVNNEESMKNGMPTSCKDLNELGYTLKGFFLVKNPNISAIETIFCDFKETPNSGVYCIAMSFDLPNTRMIF